MRKYIFDLCSLGADCACRCTEEMGSLPAHRRGSQPCAVTTREPQPEAEQGAETARKVAAALDADEPHTALAPLVTEPPTWRCGTRRWCRLYYPLVRGDHNKNGDHNEALLILIFQSVPQTAILLRVLRVPLVHSLINHFRQKKGLQPWPWPTIKTVVLSEFEEHHWNRTKRDNTVQAQTGPI